MKNLVILLLTAFILSCATAPPPQISDDGFISSRPNFQVQFHKPIIEKTVESRRIQHGDIKSYYFFINKREGLAIEILTYIPSRGGIEFYGAEQVLTNWGRIALDSVVIDGGQWLKFINVSENNFLFTGYFKIMDNYYISIGRFCTAGVYAKEIDSIKSGTPLNHRQKKSLDEEFSKADQLFSIGKK